MSEITLYTSAINKNNILMMLSYSVWFVSIMLKSKRSGRNAGTFRDEQNVVLCSVHQYRLQTRIVAWIEFEWWKEPNNSISLAILQRSLRNTKGKLTKARVKSEVFVFLKIVFPSLKFYFIQSRSVLGYLHEIRFCLHLAQTRSLFETDEKGLGFSKKF